MQTSTLLEAVPESAPSPEAVTASGAVEQDFQPGVLAGGMLAFLGRHELLEGQTDDPAFWWRQCPELAPLSQAMERSWGDTPMAIDARESWPAFDRAPAASWITAAAALARVPVEFVRMAREVGVIRFAEAFGGPALVLRSDCGRRAEAFRLDGALWTTTTGFSSYRVLPGSLETVPLGLQSLVPEAPWVAVTGPSLGFVSMLGILAEMGAWDCALVAVSSPDFQFCREFVLMLRGRRVRFFLPETEAWRESAAGWAEMLTAAGCTVDAFGFAGYHVHDAAGFALLPSECKQTAKLTPEA